MKILYLDCFSGISGDMMVGALTDLGVQPSTFEWELSKVEIGDFHMHFERQSRQNVQGIKFGIHEGSTHTHDQDEEEHEHQECARSDAKYGHTHEEYEHSHEDCAHLHQEHATHDQERQAPDQEHAIPDEEHAIPDEEHAAPDEEHATPDEEHAHSHEGCGHSHEEHERSHGRNHREIRELILSSGLSDYVKEKSLAIFQRIAVAEGKIHGMPPEEVTFHEVGALDSIADIICTCVGIETLGVEKVLVSKLFDGTGWIECDHGRFPIPVPATLEILAGIPLSQIDEPFEFITPTGAAIVAEFGSGFGPMPELTVQKIGYGLGSRQSTARPNVLRAVLADWEPAP